MQSSIEMQAFGAQKNNNSCMKFQHHYHKTIINNHIYNSVFQVTYFHGLTKTFGRDVYSCHLGVLNKYLVEHLFIINFSIFYFKTLKNSKLA